VTAAIDTNVLLDLLGPDPASAHTARQAIAMATGTGAVVICPIVYAELAAGFGRQDDLDRFLRDLRLQLEDFSAAALARAGEAWRIYARRRGQRVQCPRCGSRFDLPCPSCHVPIAWRQHVIPDFLIGGHAVTQANYLITRDPGYYRTYFPQLRLEVPTP
jgi:predicted nucleic acid-binding protein